MRISAVAALLVAGWAPAGGRADDALRDRAVAAHEASLATIRTIRANISVSVELTDDSSVPNSAELRRTSPTLPGFKGEYLRDGALVRINTQESSGGPMVTIRNLADRTALSMVGTAGPREVREPVEVTGGRDYGHDSPLDLGDGYLFFLPRPVPPDYDTAASLARTVARAKAVTARTEALDGVETVRLDLTMDGDGNRFEVWLDPGTNYLFRRIQSIRRGRPLSDMRVLQYAEPKPGVFVPARAELVIFRATRSVLSATSIRVNEPIPASLFDTRLPAGSRVVDHEEAKIFRVGAGGTPDTVVGRVVQPPPQGTASEPPVATPLDADEPRWWSWSRVLILASVLLVVGGVVVQRRRAA